ncbi:MULTISPECIES: hypothetical protein [Bacteroides]|uniref:hypothetical protein n=2 Tax=Bacteroides TaxID=816 RepID=UPI0005A62DB1|nr:hypothetical protein [Bacteroides neonati]
MGYDLIPVKKEAGSPSGMISTWPMILNETGAGYLFGYGDNTVKPGFYIYNGKRGPGSPVSNDGFKVSASEAKAMAKLFRGYAHVKRAIREEGEILNSEERAIYSKFKWYKEPPSEEFIKKVEELAEFCEKSGGFRIT